MQERLTISAARNIFFGGTIFFFAVFALLVVQSVIFVNDEASNPEGITEEVALGKEVWERHSCINCHSLLGEGAYYAPELGNVWVRRGGKDDAEGASEFIKEWIKSQPTGIEGRRQMPHYDLTEAELEGLVQFFKWTSEINTQNWPPNDAG
ncbi:cytochrome c [Terasakiella sp. A23]|uniref:c-type cytochrome n=1 Tax=Terasakiella sp. FCG-A23 TaxID=3080561 RepID=UPI002955210E|nr:cytochrome c [Terasakiella sp. A23]MDV7339160.1 cytochrome c [Terasakiella sp. A23]